MGKSASLVFVVSAVLGLSVATACDDGETGGDGGTGGGGGSIGGGGTGGSGGDGGSGGSGDAIEVDPRCSNWEFRACGGALTGTWTVDHTCATFDFDDNFEEIWPTPAGCSFLHEEVAHEVAGTLSYDGATETAALEYRSTYRYTVPDECVAGLGLGGDLEVACDAVGRRVAPETPGACVHDDTGCVCDYELRGQDSWVRELEEFFEGAMDYVDDPDDGFTYCVEGRSLVRSYGDRMMWFVR